MKTRSQGSGRISVMGLGDVLLGDAAFGPLTIEMFRCEYECDAAVDVLDLGTPGVELSPYLERRALIVVVDAVRGDSPPGTVSTFREQDFEDHPGAVRLTDRDPDLWESLSQLGRAGRAPAELIVVGVAPETFAQGDGISSGVFRSASAAGATIAQLLKDRGISCRRRSIPVEPDLWWLRRKPEQGTNGGQVSLQRGGEKH